jgi:hypothetical protein
LSPEQTPNSIGEQTPHKPDFPAFFCGIPAGPFSWLESASCP